MFKADAYGYTFGLHGDVAFEQHAVDIAGRMACGQYDGTSVFAAVGRNHTFDAIAVTVHDKVGDAASEPNLAAVVNDCLAHGLDDYGQPVGAYMWMRVDKDVVAGTVGVEYLEHLIDGAAFCAAGV